MTEDRKGFSLMQLALGASLIAVAAVGVAAFVPRSRLRLVTEPLRDALEWPIVGATLLWAASLWSAEPRAPEFDDLRPFDEF